MRFKEMGWIPHLNAKITVFLYKPALQKTGNSFKHSSNASGGDFLKYFQGIRS
jgi:hypothetical protein